MRWTDPLSYPWALVPYGYYGPIRECEWVRDNRAAKCPYNMKMLEIWYPKKGKEVPLSANPFCKPDSEWNPYSLKRISEDGRVCGSLEVSRSFGDARLKDKGLSSTPEVTSFALGAEQRFVLLGCDGVWAPWSGAQHPTTT